MKFPCTVEQSSDGRWKVRHTGGDLGMVEAAAPTRDEALEKMRQELRYRLELCPCTGESYQHLEIEVLPAADQPPWQPRRAR